MTLASPFLRPQDARNAVIPGNYVSQKALAVFIELPLQTGNGLVYLFSADATELMIPGKYISQNALRCSPPTRYTRETAFTVRFLWLERGDPVNYVSQKTLRI